MQQHRPTYEVKVFLHMNLLYELIKYVKRNRGYYMAAREIQMISLRVLKNISLVRCSPRDIFFPHKKRNFVSPAAV